MAYLPLAACLRRLLARIPACLVLLETGHRTRFSQTSVRRPRRAVKHHEPYCAGREARDVPITLSKINILPSRANTLLLPTRTQFSPGRCLKFRCLRRMASYPPGPSSAMIRGRRPTQSLLPRPTLSVRRLLGSNAVLGFASVLYRELLKQPGDQPTRLPSEDEFNEAVINVKNITSILEQFRFQFDWCKDNLMPHNPAHEVKKRRGRVAPSGLCHERGIIDTPEWRRGPDGARTLCNACGLHYAKLERKRQLEAPHLRALKGDDTTGRI